MPLQPRQFREVTGAEVVSATGAETVVATLAGIDTTKKNYQVMLQANVPVKCEGSVTTVTVRIRRTSLTGTEVAAIKVKTGASTEQFLALNALDTPGEVGNLTYVCTIAGAASAEVIAEKARLSAEY